MASIREVARACGVSAMTVSYVINDNTERVSAETRERVLKAVRELGYRPPAPKRNRREIGYTIGLVTGARAHSLQSPGYSGNMMQGILEATDVQGCHLMLFHQSLFHNQDTTQSLRVYCDGYCDGLIVLAPLIGNSLIPALLERGFPIMVIGDSDPDSLGDFVDVNNEEIGQRAAQYLLGHGHQRLVFLHGQDFIRSSLQRRLGFRQTTEAAELPPEARLEVLVTPEQPETFGQFRKLLTLPSDQRPTAVMGWNDTTALWAHHEATRIGLRVPEDISIIGVDNVPEAAALGLTTFSQPVKEITNLAVSTLLKRMKRETMPPYHRLRHGQLIERQSVLL